MEGSRGQELGCSEWKVWDRQSVEYAAFVQKEGDLSTVGKLLTWLLGPAEDAHLVASQRIPRSRAGGERWRAPAARSWGAASGRFGIGKVWNMLPLFRRRAT